MIVYRHIQCTCTLYIYTYCMHIHVHVYIHVYAIIYCGGVLCVINIYTHKFHVLFSYSNIMYNVHVQRIHVYMYVDSGPDGFKTVRWLVISP